MTESKRKVCELCCFAVVPAEAEERCCYTDCPMYHASVRNVGDELGQVLGEALRANR